jgi:general secretion pathway protein E
MDNNIMTTPTKSDEMDIEILKIGDHLIDPDSAMMMPQLFCYSTASVILDVVSEASDDPIHVGMADPENVDNLDTIQRKFSPRKIIAVKLSTEDVTKALNHAFGIAPATTTEPQDSVTRYEKSPEPQEKKQPEIQLSDESSPEKVNSPNSEVPKKSRTSARTKKTTSAVDLVNTLLLDSIRRGATDIHIENERRAVVIRIKLDGLLYETETGINKDNISEVVNRLKVMSGLDISEHRGPQDGRILIRTLRGRRDYDVPFRISILPGPYGEEVVLRVLDKSMAPINLELLGFTSDDLIIFRKMIHNPQGMILVTGPTGSGKTTTLYASLKEVNTPHNKILSAEDPIEYNIEGVSQKQVTNKFGFSDMARAFLRHDPDILLIGEIRDEPTADVAVKAAQTGHLVLSTLHTNDSVSTISRLNVLGLDYDLIGSSLLGVLSQRLVRRVCENCQEEYVPTENSLSPFKKHIQMDKFVHGRGCDYCNHTGYRGRIGLFELFVIDHQTQKMIYDAKSLDDILEYALEKGMTPLVVDGLRKTEMGITTLEELHRVIPMRQIVMQLGLASFVKRTAETLGKAHSSK